MSAFAQTGRRRDPFRRGAVPGQRKLRIAVPPLLASDNSVDQEMLAKVSEAFAKALKQFRLLDVIFLESLFSGAADVRLSGEQLESDSLDYVLDGAASSDRGHAHIHLRLFDAASCARTVWAERFSFPLAKLPQWSELIAGRIVAGIDPATIFFDGHPRRRNRSGADGLLLAAIPLISSMKRRKYEEAGRLIDRALNIEPDNPRASAWAAFWQVLYFGQGWTQNLAKSSAIAQVRASRAISLTPDDPETLAICGHVSSFLVRDYDRAFHYFERAQRTGPFPQSSWLWSALTYCYAGKPDLALEQLDRHRTFTAVFPRYTWILNIYSVAFVFSGNYEKAVVSGSRAVQITPGFVNGYKPLIASLGHLGRAEEAQPYVDKLLALEPNFTVERFGKVYPIKHNSDREHYMKGLRLAGVPER